MKPALWINVMLKQQCLVSLPANNIENLQQRSFSRLVLELFPGWVDVHSSPLWTGRKVETLLPYNWVLFYLSSETGKWCYPYNWCGRVRIGSWWFPGFIHIYSRVLAAETTTNCSPYCVFNGDWSSPSVFPLSTPL